MPIMTRPNIVFITADQHRADCLAEGRQIKRLISIDWPSKARGFIGDYPLCDLPAGAASILTGQLPRTHGVR